MPTIQYEVVEVYYKKKYGKNKIRTNLVDASRAFELTEEDESNVLESNWVPPEPKFTRSEILSNQRLVNNS